MSVADTDGCDRYVGLWLLIAKCARRANSFLTAVQNVARLGWASVDQAQHSLGKNHKGKVILVHSRHPGAKFLREDAFAALKRFASIKSDFEHIMPNVILYQPKEMPREDEEVASRAGK
ncbi:hypothetical protein JNB88_27360 [Rhizobium cauense]|uniref:hypothetical protein n=1 Tax=Rhizobium cauense TaxID=1166683 RepID=UPI001C6DF4F4|nr:hypothetical protein [Rhizobium cauense]MBW9117342.1 hypothetical protein [Rhizobium cauense]